MSVTATEFRRNVDEYLMLAATEDVYITRNGVTIAKISNPNLDRINAVKSLLGVLPADSTLEEAREERLNRL